jgi:hypothetical protein
MAHVRGVLIIIRAYWANNVFRFVVIEWFIIQNSVMTVTKSTKMGKILLFKMFISLNKTYLILKFHFNMNQ